MFINFSHLFNVHLLFNVIDVNIRSMHYFNGCFFLICGKSPIPHSLRYPKPPPMFLCFHE